MNLRAVRMIGAAVLAIPSAWPSLGQAQGTVQTAVRPPLPSPSQTVSEEPVVGQILREIDDPHSGDRWLLMRVPNRPGAPGRLVLATVPGAVADKRLPADRPQPLPVIHTGDRLIVEEKTALVEGRLEAVALGPALSGSLLKVRLAVGGTVVRAVALGPGRAAFATETRVRP